MDQPRKIEDFTKEELQQELILALSMLRRMAEQRNQAQDRCVQQEAHAELMASRLQSLSAELEALKEEKK